MVQNVKVHPGEISPLKVPYSARRTEVLISLLLLVISLCPFTIPILGAMRGEKAWRQEPESHIPYAKRARIPRSPAKTEMRESPEWFPAGAGATRMSEFPQRRSHGSLKWRRQSFFYFGLAFFPGWELRSVLFLFPYFESWMVDE